MAKKKSPSLRENALQLFEQQGGVLRTSEAISRGIHPRTLYELKQSGHIIQISRGLYAISTISNASEPDFITVTKKIPNGVICLISALYFHHLTLQIPKWIDIAIPQNYNPPALKEFPVRFHWFSDSVLHSEIEVHDMNGIRVRIYSSEKSIVDAFRLRKKIGLNIALEALKIYLKTQKYRLPLLRKLAIESRVLRIIDPYLEALLHDQS